jgi:hypothetical protein
MTKCVYCQEVIVVDPARKAWISTADAGERCSRAPDAIHARSRIINQRSSG